MTDLTLYTHEYLVRRTLVDLSEDRWSPCPFLLAPAQQEGVERIENERSFPR